MLTDLKHLPVHWIDGMKISRRHFEETDRYIHEQIRDCHAQHLTDFNFGILPAERSLDMNVFCDFSQQINIELNSCKAITSNGSRIQVLPQGPVKINANFKEIATRYGLQLSQPQNMYIVVSVDIFTRIPAGEPILEETPPRHPYSQPEIKLDIIPVEYLNTVQLTSGLVIGKISYMNGELIHQKEFIPPCTAVNSLPVVLDWFNKFRQLMENCELYCVRIIQKVNSKGQQPNALANSIQKLSEKVLEQLISQKLHYKWIISKMPPVYLCESLLRNIYHLYTSLQCYNEKEREEMLNYFAEWTDIQAGTIENQTIRSLQIQYNHNDLDLVFNEISQVYNLYVQIFQRLSQLDYMGKHKGQNIFVIEQEVKETKPVHTPEKPASRWSPLG